MLNISKYDISFYCNKIETNQQFALVRYGDGEIAAMLGEEGGNCDGHEYFPEMGKLLRESLHIYERELDDSYFYSLVRIARIVYGYDLLNEYLNNLGPNIKWHDGTVFVDASRNGELYPLLSVLRQKKIMYVGPAYLNSYRFDERLFPISKFITVPSKNSFSKFAFIKQEILDSWDDDYDLIGFSAGPTTKVLVNHLYCSPLKQSLPYKNHQIATIMIDFGSLWDGFMGAYTRSYMRTKSWHENVMYNLVGK